MVITLVVCGGGGSRRVVGCGSSRWDVETGGGCEVWRGIDVGDGGGSRRVVGGSSLRVLVVGSTLLVVELGGGGGSRWMVEIVGIVEMVGGGGGSRCIVVMDVVMEGRGDCVRVSSGGRDVGRGGSRLVECGSQSSPRQIVLVVLGGGGLIVTVAGPPGQWSEYLGLLERLAAARHLQLSPRQLDTIVVMRLLVELGGGGRDVGCSPVCDDGVGRELESGWLTEREVVMVITTGVEGERVEVGMTTIDVEE